VSSLAIDPANSLIVYAATYDYFTSSRRVFKSNNGGASWILANSGMTVKRVNDLAIDPTNSQTVYAATDLGVLKTLLSDNIPVITGAASATLSEGIPAIFRVNASGWPAPQLSVSGTLPAGISFNSATGVLSGTPTVGSAGTYSLIVTATNGVPPDAVRGITLTVQPASSLAAVITSPVKNASLASLASITGTASGSGLSKVEVQVTDGFFYLQSGGTFTTTPAWLTASGTTAWYLNTSAVVWRESIGYNITARASTGSTTSAPASSTFTMAVPTGKTGTLLSMTFTPNIIRAGVRPERHPGDHPASHLGYPQSGSGHH
jgi:hypothetical protein